MAGYTVNPVIPVPSSTATTTSLVSSEGMRTLIIAVLTLTACNLPMNGGLEPEPATDAGMISTLPE